MCVRVGKGCTFQQAKYSCMYIVSSICIMLSSTTELVGHEYVTSHNPKPLLLYIQADEYEKHIKIDHNDEIV